jgi:hypothetical protein
MSRLKAVASIAFALGLIPACGASAAENPFYRVGARRVVMMDLGHTMTMKAQTNFTFDAARVQITCKEFSLNITAQGEFTGCVVKGNGSSCAISGHKITTFPLTAFLGFASSTRGGRLLTVTQPVVGETDAQVQFEGARCNTRQTTLEGGVAAENVVRGRVVERGVAESDAQKIVEVWPSVPITTVFVEEGGKLEKVRVGLRMFGRKARLAGQLKLTLANRQKWGVFSVALPHRPGSSGADRDCPLVLLSCVGHKALPAPGRQSVSCLDRRCGSPTRCDAFLGKLGEALSSRFSNLLDC